jgi:hypothetical protein
MRALASAKDALNEALGRIASPLLLELLMLVENDNAAAAMIGIEEFQDMNAVKDVQYRLCDLMAWRAQLCAPVESRELYIACCREAWLILGLQLPDKQLARLLHAHRKEISEHLPNSFLSQTKRQSAARGGTIRQRRSRSGSPPRIRSGRTT